MYGLPTADNNPIAESKDYRKTPAFFEVLHLFFTCVTAVYSSEVAGQLKEHNNKGTVGSLGSSEYTDTGTVQFQAYIYTHSCNQVMSSVFCMLFITLLYYLFVRGT